MKSFISLNILSYALAYSSPSHLPGNVDKRTHKRLGNNHKESIRFVEWAGCKGLLPLQHFQNVMDPQQLKGWLRKPLPIHFDENEDVVLHLSNKESAEKKASTPLDPNVHLQPIYVDAHICVVNKASGVLSVPGPRRNPSVGGLVHEYFGNLEDDVDCMIVHRLDMDTSGIICYARSKLVLGILHDAFRNKSSSNGGEETVQKTYEALVCGHMKYLEGEIDLPLVRDRSRPPFMKVGFGFEEEITDENVQKHRGYMKMMSKPPKESFTLYRVLAYEYIDSLPITRVELVPITGRTHQLRVHLAAIGHPIVGDNIYGFNGDGSSHAGLLEEARAQFKDSASELLQKQIFEMVENRRRRNLPNSFYNGDLCLHAKQLTFLHPITKAPMIFGIDAPF